jgi:hypothetical protein
MSEGWLQLAKEAIKLPGLLVEVYGDLAKPGVRQVGKALETIFGLGNTILWPITLANERLKYALEHNLEKYRKCLEKIPEEKIISISPEIGVPVVEKLSYISDDQLSDLYIQLLAKASNVDTLEHAHPSFVNVINNLTPDEAHLLEYFVTQSDLPFIYAKSVRIPTQEFILLRDLIVPDEILRNLSFPQNVDAYFSNLEGLGLININHIEWLTDTNIYDELKKKYTEQFIAIMNSDPKTKGNVLCFDQGFIRITRYGEKFIQACHTNKG